MVEVGCQDKDWVGENDKEVLDAILQSGVLGASFGALNRPESHRR